MDGRAVVIGGCDKNQPGGMIGMLRTNVPSIYVYGGADPPGNWKGTDLTVGVVVRSRGRIHGPPDVAGRFAKGSRRTRARPRVQCGGMYTANTMSSVVRGARHVAAVFVDDGQSGPGTSSAARMRARAGEAVDKDLKPRDIVTKKSIENAVALIMATGGSTMPCCTIWRSHAAEVEWTIEDFERHAQESAVICNLKPSASSSRPICTRRRYSASIRSCSTRACSMATASRSPAERPKGTEGRAGKHARRR